MADTGTWWAIGKVAAGSMSVADDIGRFTEQTDMYDAFGTLFAWTIDQEASIIVPAHVEPSLGFSQSEQGGDSSRLVFPLVTPLMMAYLYDTQLNGQRYYPATLRQWNRQTGAYEFRQYEAAWWPSPDTIKQLERVVGGLRNFPIDLTGGVDVTP